MNLARILIIDDEKAIVDSFGAYLEDYGYEILTASNGRLGVEVFTAEQPDLVLVDLRMPEMDGIQVLEHIKKVSPLTPLIVASGTGVISDAVEALHGGAWDYLLKPIGDLSLLKHSVEAALEKSRLQAENLQYREKLEQLVVERTEELSRANTHLSQINKRLHHIVDTTRTLSFCQEVQRFGSLLLEEFGQHMLASGGSIYLREENGLQLVHSLDSGHAAEFIPFPLPQNSLFQRAIETKKPILEHNIGEEVDPSGWEGYSDGSALIFPLPDETGGIAGIMTLHSKISPPFVEQDREIGTILASYSCEALRAVRATEQLRESEARFRRILDIIPIGIVIIDAETQKIVYSNPIAANLIGSEVQSIIGKTRNEVFVSVQEGKPSTGDGQDVDQVERVELVVEGRVVPVLKTVSQTTLQGRDCSIESFVDLSRQLQAERAREQLEEQLHQAQKMEALGTLAGGVAHDFNNILSAVLGYSELGLKQLGDPNNPLHTKLKAINSAGMRAKELVDQILTFSRMQEQAKVILRLNPIISEVLKLLKSSLPADISLKTAIKVDQPILGDPTQIHQIIMNLCTNAYHAMQQSGGVLSVELNEVKMGHSGRFANLGLPPGHYTHLSVSDTGSGISPSILNRIFDPYFTTKGKDKGSGLGLAVVHGMVKRHGGEITVESLVGEGTTFEVFLPVSEGGKEEDGSQEPPLPKGTEQVLLVDDEESLVLLGTEMLELLGYKVQAVVGSVQALEIFKQDPNRYDLVISDYNMPGMSGDQLSREILAIRPDIAIIISTGFTERLDEQQARAIGIRKLVMKPLSLETLALSSREVLDSSVAG